MTNTSHSDRNPSRRAVVTGGASFLGAGGLSAEVAAAAEPTATSAEPFAPPIAPPGGYNILFILVDQEHFFDHWPMPVPGRKWLKENGIAFTNHQAASCVCSPGRSTIYTGQHIQHTGVFDNANSLWQPDMSVAVKTIGHRLAMLGYRVGEDDGAFLPIRHGKWFFPPRSER
jgi:Sulfatase